ncbi:MAG: hypothetical protein D6743_10455 [Calditrichaeota bacterium]|nr:MAG: hypothetical protein D6743_10455 [Calditrichota bacterium]
MADDLQQDKTQSPVTRKSMSRIFIGSILVGLACGVIGLLIGATIGGNMAGDFRFAGNRGYEATGVLGALSGLLVGVVGGAIALTCLPRKNKPS